MQVLAFLDHFGIADDDPRVNPYGGAIAIGHPLASSGVRLMTQLARQFAEHPEVRYGLTTMCVGLGMGGTVIWENPDYGRGAPAPRDGARSEHASGDRGGTAPSFADEVVTQALVRDVELPGLAGELALITLDNGLDHTRPTTFGPAGLAALDAALDEIEAHVAAGRRDRGHRQAVHLRRRRRPVRRRRGRRPRTARCELGRLGHQVFRRLRDSAVPTFAFVNGAALGGGLELALHCDYRTLSQSARRRWRCRRCFLGLVPGWGGTQLLPRPGRPGRARSR